VQEILNSREYIRCSQSVWQTGHQ